MNLTLEEKLGRGPAGACYRARTGEGQAVAAKVLRQAFRESPPLYQRIQADVQRWIGFSHPHALATLGWTEVQGRDVVIEELSGAPSCAALLAQQGQQDVRVAMRIARDVALCLAGAHQAGLAVGDVRPAKIYYDPQEGAKLSDLGLAVASCLAAGYGQVGLRFGHPGYLAPEVTQGPLPAPTPASDVYALGMTFYELVTGRLPYQGDPRQVLSAQLEQPLPIPSGVGITPQVAKWLLRMTAKHPRRRFPNGVSAVNALYRVIGQPPPFPEEPEQADTAKWNTLVEESSRGSQTWSEDRVAQAAPVAPKDVGQRRVSERLPRMDFMASAEVEPGEVEPAPPQKPKPEAGGDEGGLPEGPQVRVGQQIGRGPAGATYEGVLKDHEGAIVIKSLTRRFNKHEELLEGIMARVNRAADVKGPRVLPFLESLKAQGRMLLVYKRAQGPCLRQVLTQQGAQPIPKVLGWLKNLAEALASAQEAEGQVHGDIRPEKVYFDEKGVSVLLTDFGLCGASCLAANYGAAGMHFGHPAYLAPEVIQEGRHEPDLVSDIYSLGILLYEAISGVQPFRGEPKDLLLQHLKQSPPPPQNVSVPKPLAELIIRLTSKVPKSRPQTPHELIAAVELCQKQILLTTGLRKVVQIDEFDPTDSGEDARNSLDAWEADAEAQVQTTGSWSRSKLAELGPVGPDMSMMASEELSPEDNPFADR